LDVFLDVELPGHLADRVAEELVEAAAGLGEASTLSQGSGQ
jgi:hypothetical protein